MACRSVRRRRPCGCTRASSSSSRPSTLRSSRLMSEVRTAAPTRAPASPCARHLRFRLPRLSSYPHEDTQSPICRSGPRPGSVASGDPRRPVHPSQHMHMVAGTVRTAWRRRNIRPGLTLTHAAPRRGPHSAATPRMHVIETPLPVAPRHAAHCCGYVRFTPLNIHCVHACR